MGYSFAAGTTDGPGAFDFKQGEICSKLAWYFKCLVKSSILNETSDSMKLMFLQLCESYVVSVIIIFVVL